MSNDLVIPTNIPSFLLNKAAAAAIIDDAAAGIGTGMPPRIKLSAKSFMLVDANGEEKAFPPSQMFAGEDGFYMPAVILRAKRAFNKAFYLEAYNPNNDEAKAPDCFSTDGVRPDASALAPQNDTCAGCPRNAFGSGKDQNGNATKGKACTDNKILAVFAAGAVFQLKVPPASLKNYRQYLDQIRINLPDVPLYAIKTLIGFEAQSDFPILKFAFGGFVGADNPEKQEAMVVALAKKAQSPEAEAIIGGPSVTMLPPPVVREALPPGPSPEELAAKAKAEAEAEEKEKAEKAAKAAKAKAAKEAKAKAEEEARLAAEAATPEGATTDDLLRAELGL